MSRQGLRLLPPGGDKLDHDGKQIVRLQLIDANFEGMLAPTFFNPFFARETQETAALVAQLQLVFDRCKLNNVSFSRHFLLI